MSACDEPDRGNQQQDQGDQAYELRLPRRHAYFFLKIRAALPEFGEEPFKSQCRPDGLSRLLSKATPTRAVLTWYDNGMYIE